MDLGVSERVAPLLEQVRQFIQDTLFPSNMSLLLRSRSMIRLFLHAVSSRSSVR